MKKLREGGKGGREEAGWEGTGELARQAAQVDGKPQVSLPLPFEMTSR